MWNEKEIRARGQKVVTGISAKDGGKVYLFPWQSLGQNKWICGKFTGEVLTPTEKSFAGTPLFYTDRLEIEGGIEAVFNAVDEYHRKNPRATSGDQSRRFYSNAKYIGIKLNILTSGLIPQNFYYMQWTGEVLTSRGTRPHTYEALLDKEREVQGEPIGHTSAVVNGTDGRRAPDLDTGVGTDTVPMTDNREDRAMGGTNGGLTCRADDLPF